VTARRLVIEGRVQGVGYRDWVLREATRLGLSGWVRNRADGRVEAVITGPEPAVAALLSLCRRGPTLARVDALEETFWEDEVEPGFFRR
jgi:acylphosphatase